MEKSLFLVRNKAFCVSTCTSNGGGDGPPPPGRHSRTPELTRRLSASSNSTQSWTGYLDPSAASYTPNSSSLESAMVPEPARTGFY